MKLLARAYLLGYNVFKGQVCERPWHTKQLCHVGQQRSCSSNSGDFTSTLQKFGGGSVRLTKDDSSGIAHVVLDHPEKKNAVSGKMMCDMLEAVTDLEQWEVGKGVLLYGSDGMFCSGADLDLVRGISEPWQGEEMSKFMQEVVLRLHSLPLISVALIQGRALGGGAELTTACDFRLVTESVSVGFVHPKMGIVTGWGGGYRLAQIVGPTNALEILSTAKILSSRGALDLHFASAVLPDGSSAIDIAEDWLRERISWPAQTVQAVKKVVLNSRNPDIKSAFQTEKEIFASVWGAPAHKEAIMKSPKHK